MRSESGETANVSFVNARCDEGLKRSQSEPRTKRNTGSVFAVVVQSIGALHEETFSVAAVCLPRRSVTKAGDRRIFPSGIRSPSRSGRPSSPPKFPRKSVERLPRTIGTPMPPEIASQDRHPSFGGLTISSSPALINVAWPAGNDVDPTRTSNSPPHQATVRSSSKRSRKPPSVISRPASDSSLPTRRFATRNACESSAPPSETPNSRKPIRPTSCTLVKNPARRAFAVTAQSRTDRINRICRIISTRNSFELNRVNPVNPVQCFIAPGVQTRSA